MAVAIIGAGPSGSFLGAKLEWDKATVFDKKPEVGRPVQCTGIVTSSIFRVLPDLPPELQINHIETYRIKSPDGRSIDVDLNKKDIVMDRAAFDRHIASLATDKDVPFKMKHKLKGWKKIRNEKRYRLFFSNGKTFDAEYIVGADGPYSTVAKNSGMFGRREILTGYQARVRIKKKEQEFDEHVTEILFGLGEFAWIVPENKKVARIGIIGKNVAQEYRKLIKPYRFLEDQSGAIPMYNPKQRMQKGNIALIGDAATQVKPTTYGGIIYGLISAGYIGEKWESYEKRFRAKLGKDLWLSLKMRNIMNTVSEEEASELVRIFEKEENKEILSKSDRNFPSKFIVRLLLKETKLWKYGFRAFKQ